MVETSEVIRRGIFKFHLYTNIKINASSEQVWKVLTDMASYREWNPVFPSAAGEAKVGSNLEVIINWPGLKASKYKLKVIAVKPAQELRWLGHFVFPGLLDGNHAFYIEPLGENCVRLVQLEDFVGLVVPLFEPWLKRNVLHGFQKLNQALKSRVEGTQSKTSTAHTRIGSVQTVTHK